MFKYIYKFKFHVFIKFISLIRNASHLTKYTWHIKFYGVQNTLQLELNFLTNLNCLFFMVSGQYLGYLL